MSGDSKEQVSIFSKRLTYSLQCRLYLFTTYLHLSEFYLRETMGCDLRKSSMNEISSETKPDGLHLIVLFSIARISVGLLVGAIVSYRRARKTPRRKRRQLANRRPAELDYCAPLARHCLYRARTQQRAHLGRPGAMCQGRLFTPTPKGSRILATSFSMPFFLRQAVLPRNASRS